MPLFTLTSFCCFHLFPYYIQVRSDCDVDCKANSHKRVSGLVIRWPGIRDPPEVAHRLCDNWYKHCDKSGWVVHHNWPIRLLLRAWGGHLTIAGKFTAVKYKRCKRGWTPMTKNDPIFEYVLNKLTNRIIYFFRVLFINESGSYNKGWLLHYSGLCSPGIHLKMSTVCKVGQYPYR